ncbi:MAG TPA: hypothetical protein VNA20_10110 [Frankiaceae bacterium]|nr:hypothetical protein [Frankiaceae bacterium]
MSEGVLAALALAALAAGSLPATSHAAARPPLVRQVSLTGDRTGWTPVSLPRPVAAECAGQPTCAAKAALRLSGGAFGYFLVYENDRALKPAPSVVVVRMPKAQGGQVIAIAGGTDPRTGSNVADTGVLPPGPYRMFLLTNGSGAMSVRFPELAAARVSLRTRHASTYRAVETAPTYVGPLAPSAWAGGITVPETGIRSHGYVFEWTKGPAAAGVVSALCLYNGAPPADTWLPGCPNGDSLMSNQLMPGTECCGTAYGAVVGAGTRFSFGSYYVQNGPVTSAGRFVVWVSDR